MEQMKISAQKKKRLKIISKMVMRYYESRQINYYFGLLRLLLLEKLHAIFSDNLKISFSSTQKRKKEKDRMREKKR